MVASRILPRHAEPLLLETLSDTPVVLIHGSRQSGKTTLAQAVGEPRGYTYFSFDDAPTRAAAESDPVGFAADAPARTILDEVQKVPDLFGALKTVVDRDRVAGRFLLTGSSNVLLLPKLSDSLAGRMGILRLFPFSQCEIEEREPWFLEALFAAEFPTRRFERLGKELAERIVAGGYPAALMRASPHRRAAWYRDFVESLVQRDVRDMTRLQSLDVLPRLLSLAAGQTAHLINVSDLASPFSLSRPTIRDYVTHLERVFLLEELPPWHSNRLSRLIKTPKLHMGDTGLACALLGLDASALAADRDLLGQLVETFVLQELRREAGGRQQEYRLHHYRDKDRNEVDVVIERGGNRIAGVEVKSAATVRSRDFRGLRKLESAAGRRFCAGAVLYDGETCAGFGARMFAVPIRALWEPA
jgi:predicted AAA+ superfamily ATPase